MKYYLLGNEENVADIAVKVYGDLSATRKAEVEGMLLKANPELKLVDRMQPGTLIHIPDTAKAPDANKREVVDPIEGLKTDIIRQLKALETEVKRSHSRHRRQQEESARILHSARKGLQEHPRGEKVAGRLKRHIKDSKISDDESKDKRLKALGKLRKMAGSVRG